MCVVKVDGIVEVLLGVARGVNKVIELNVRIKTFDTLNKQV